MGRHGIYPLLRNPTTISITNMLISHDYIEIDRGYYYDEKEDRNYRI